MQIMESIVINQRKNARTSTVGRGKAVTLDAVPTADHWTDGEVTLCFGDSLNHYSKWAIPTVIVSDGAYGILGFEGDTSDHLDMPHWYEPHIKVWSERANAQTTLWFWNSEIGWATVHPVLQKYGWRYVNANVWNKGKAHIAGNVNICRSSKTRRWSTQARSAKAAIFFCLFSCLFFFPPHDRPLDELTVRKHPCAAGGDQMPPDITGHFFFFPGG